MPKTKEQVAAYNREYFARPDVKARAKVRNAKPEHVERRRLYKLTQQGKDAEKRYRQTEPSRRYQHEYRLKKLYGITESDYQRIAHEQDHECAICEQPVTGRLHIDHCHATGKVRGLLCGSCNRGIGLFRDNPDLLSAAAAYLEAGDAV